MRSHNSATTKRKRYDSSVSTDVLPLLISIPHGGWYLPRSIQDRIQLDQSDIFPDSDPYTHEIYGLKDEVLYYHQSDIARAVVDLNRAHTDLPPQNPDGVIKSHTIMDKEVYYEGRQPNLSEIHRLLRQFYYPYHLKIDADMKDHSLLCCFDCHSMLEHLPGTPAIPENDRPFICLSNLGDENGDGNENNRTCQPEMIRLFADCLRDQFPEEADNIHLNTPFRGGFISRFHSRKLPWIQIELNRRAYLHKPWFDEETLHVQEKRLQDLRDAFLQAFITFCKESANNSHIIDSRYQKTKMDNASSFYN